MRRLLLPFVLLVVLLVAACSGEETARPVAADPPVLLVPGLGGTTSDFVILEAALEEEGREVVLVELDPDWPDFDTQVAILDAAVGDSAEVDVVGFSAGGLVARQWAAEGGTEAARRIVTVATPNHGTRRAVLGVDCTAACLDLLAGSDLVAGLNAGDETPAGADWGTVWSSTDGVVVPARSARLEGAVDVRVQDVCPDSTPSHLEMLSEPVAAMVVAVLSSEDPDPSGC